MKNRNNEKYIQSQLRYWCNKLAAKKAAECIILTYLSSDDSLNGSIFVNRQIVSEFTAVKKPMDTTPRKCKFKYWDDSDEHEVEFDSVGEAAKFFAYSRQAISKYIKTKKIFETFKPFCCKAQYVGE